MLGEHELSMGLSLGEFGTASLEELNLERNGVVNTHSCRAGVTHPLSTAGLMEMLDLSGAVHFAIIEEIETFPPGITCVPARR